MDPMTDMQPATAQDLRAEGDEQASPEEQRAYEIVVGMAAMGLYDEAALPAAVEALSEGDTAVTVAAVAAPLMVRVIEAAKRAGQMPSGDVLLHAGREVVDLVVELAEKVRGEDISEEDAERAFLIAAHSVQSGTKQRGEGGAEPMPEPPAGLMAPETAAAPPQAPESRGLMPGMV